MYEIGKRIKAAREKCGLSQRGLAEQLKLKNSTVSNWEQGISRPDADTIAQICSILDVSADELLGIQIEHMAISPKERRLILAYRNHPEMHPAIDAIFDLK